MKNIIKRTINYFKNRRLWKKAKSFATGLATESNPNFQKIKAGITDEEKKKLMNSLRNEIFMVISEKDQDILKRYKLWKCDFHSNTSDNFGIGISSHSHQIISKNEFTSTPENSDDKGNLFPGMIFESPFFFTPDLSRRPMVLNALGILILSGKYNPKDQITLRVVGINSSPIFKKSVVFFKIMITFDSSNYKGDDNHPMPSKRKRPIVPVAELELV